MNEIIVFIRKAMLIKFTGYIQINLFNGTIVKTNIYQTLNQEQLSQCLPDVVVHDNS